MIMSSPIIRLAWYWTLVMSENSFLGLRKTFLQWSGFRIALDALVDRLEVGKVSRGGGD